MKRAALRYHGGKWRLAPWIVGHFPPHCIYLEPYCGAASVLLAKPRATHAEIINDLNSEVVNFFRVLRNPQYSCELERMLRLTPFARQEFEEAYEPCIEPIERARRLVIRSFMGFGSSSMLRRGSTGFRSKSRNSRTSAAQDWTTYPEQLQIFTERLQAVIIEQRPALEMIDYNNTPDTLLYCDPPYVHDTRSCLSATSRYEHEMTDEDHRALAERLQQFKGLVFLSGYNSPLYEKLYHGWMRLDVDAYADGARPRRESLWFNKRAETAQRSLFS